MDLPPTDDPSVSSATMGDAAQKAGDSMVAKARESGVEIKKLVVAIHGIGDQYRQATIQSVVTQFGHHFDFPATVPLGSFYSLPGQISAFTLKSPPVAPPDLAGIGFVEAYWADIPRRVQRQGYTIQESKAWARTIVERVRARYGAAVKQAYGFKREDFLSASMVLEEMIDTIAVLGNLLFLAEKAGVLKFDLDTLLTSYLGDVQIVADFPNYRARILAQFNEVLSPVYDAIRREQADPEIYIVAHSEGTVVAFMALLQAMCAPTPGEPMPPPRPAWIERVRGFMTIGSPIDKHLLLWPAIWNAVRTPGRAPAAGPIRWRNYYDYGDPVGFELDTARAWLRDPGHDWESIGAFEFRDPLDGVPQDDYGFSRYFLPGAAHNDYWTDPGVFGHFIQTVMGLRASPEVQADFSRPPRDRLLAKLTSYVVPYLLTAGILYTGVYLLYRALGGLFTNEIVSRSPTTDCLLIVWIRDYCGVPTGPVNALVDVILNTTGISCLLAAMTLAARIPRLTRTWLWKAIAAALFLAFASLYVVLVDAPRRAWFGFYAVGSTFQASDTWWPTGLTLILACGASLLAVFGGRMRAPERIQWFLHGMRPLLSLGLLLVTGIIIFRLAHSERVASLSLWPLLLGSAAFTYLWWLAALIFDLVFVWHRYVRFATLQSHLRKLAAKQEAVS